MNIGEMIGYLKKGQKGFREGWNGRSQFIYYVPENSYPAERDKLETLKGVFDDDLVPYQDYIAIKTKDNKVVPWLASQTDLLAKDWKLIF